ncbi:zinc-binding dehydrogenase [Mucilaginibacter terrae]|uniref:zinc-dependent alcohol dehydrogenase n=1 Tax=Mucilaginibacter terrae TaxID=1955052 RepID=UPI0036409580
MKAAYYCGNEKFDIRPGTQEALIPGMVRVKIAYCGVCGTDVHIYHGKMDQRVQIPQIIGHEVAGVIEEVAPDVAEFKKGDHVAIRPLQPGLEDAADNGQLHIGKNLKFIGIDSPGGMQTYWNVPAYTLHLLPEDMPLHIGALIEPLAVACHDVRLSELKAGENVVVLGGGPIGVLIALIAQYKNASVLLSEPNINRAQMAKSLGINVVNPNLDDLVSAVEVFSHGAMADVVFEVAGVIPTVEIMTQLARARGRIIMVAIHGVKREIDLFRFFWRELKLIGVRVYEPEDFDEAIQIAASGNLPLEELITSISPLEKISEVFKAIDENPAGIKYLLKVD